MTEETTTGLPPVDAAAKRAASSMSALTSLSASDVFGEPVQAGDRVVITAAAVSRAGGFGFGGGGEEQDGFFAGGAGAGGGGGSEGRPVAVIEITPDATTVRPVFDLTKIGLTLLGTAVAVLKLTRGARKS